MAISSTNKNIILFILIIGLFNFNSLAQGLPKKENDTIIVWTKNRKLTWTDFKKATDQNTNAAQSEIGINLLSIPTDEHGYDYVILTYFYKNQSSTQTNDTLVLKHEQLHFDIAELFARKMRQKIYHLNKEKFNINRYHSEINLLYDHYFRYQKKYDNETRHSIKSEEQQEWEEKINFELHKLVSFSSKLYN